ncbi:uncharacterized protein [Salminus brasiliensis]|uniref:uncharacterized protein n=1 Tax=Salminus brasiliensis TaxID=930266 RepID=UPI003B839225
MFHNGRWRKVGAKRWSMRMANAVCAQLGCGSALAAMRTKSGGDVAEVGVLLFFDVGIRIKWFPQRIRQIEYYAELVCSEVLVKPTISTPRRVYRGQSFTITCSTQPQYPGGSFHLTHLRTNASHTRPAVNHVASFFFPAADDSNQGNYSCVYENRASFQTEGFRDYDPRGFDGWTPGPFVYNFSSSESEPLSIMVADFPLTSVITRVVLVPFLFLIICRCICLIFEKCGHHLIRDTSGQERAAAAVQSEKMKLILLQRRAEERQKVEEEEEEGPVPNPALLPM